MSGQKEKDFKKKWNNYWYYYKYHTLAGIFAVIVLALVIFAITNEEIEEEIVMTDTSGMLNRDLIHEMFDGYADEIGIDENTVVLKQPYEYAADKLAEQTGRESLTQAITSGNIDCVFVARGNEYLREVVGDFEEVLSEELKEKLGENAMAWYLDGDGNVTEELAGIVLNDAKRFKEVFGELDYYVVLQVSQYADNMENAIKFIEYLFDVN